MAGKDAPFLNYVLSSAPEMGTAGNLELISEGKLHVLAPITYLSPNYLTIRFLATVAALSGLGNKVSIVLNDSNASSHKIISKNRDSDYYLVSGKYSQQVIDQMSRILSVFNADIKNIKILKASDFWGEIIKEYRLFANFYELMGRLNVYAKDFENGKYEKIYHILEKPFISFAFRNYSDMIRSGFGNPNLLLLNNKDTEMFRRAFILAQNGPNEPQRATSIISTKMLPILESDDIYPSCYMSLSSINKIMERCRIGKTEINTVNAHFTKPVVELLRALDKLPEAYLQQRVENGNDLGFSMYGIFGVISKLIDSVNVSQEFDIKVSSSLQANSIKKLLSSKRIATVLRYCTGEYSMVEIAKKTNLQVSNVSFYLSKLRESGIVSSDKRPRLLVSNIVLPIHTLMS